MEGCPTAARDRTDTRIDTTCTEVLGGYGREGGRHLGGTLRCLGLFGQAIQTRWLTHALIVK